MTVAIGRVGTCSANDILADYAWLGSCICVPLPGGAYPIEISIEASTARTTGFPRAPTGVRRTVERDVSIALPNQEPIYFAETEKVLFVC